MTRRSWGSSSTTRTVVLFMFDLLRAQRKLHRKHRSAFRLGRYCYLSSVRFNDPLCDGKSHARTFPEPGAVHAPIKFFKYEGLLVCLDTWTRIGDTHQDAIGLKPRQDCDWTAGRRIPVGIIQK